jgi:ketosteroid isomerase-like protein
MNPPDREMARRHGQRKLDAMRRRKGQLRRRVIATAIVGFALLWAVVFVQMATGNDPALGTGTVAKKHAAIERKRRKLEASSPPPREEVEEAPSAEELGGIEAEQAEAERIEAERFETEQREAEARELEELEAVSTGQS